MILTDIDIACQFPPLHQEAGFCWGVYLEAMIMLADELDLKKPKYTW